MRNALRALTALPVPAGPVPDTIELAGRRERWSVALFPLVGVLIGLTWALAGRVVDVYQPTTVAAALVLTVDAALTGGRHLVGLGRSADALARTWPDEGVGYPGAVAMLMVTLLRFGALVFAADHATLLLAVPIAGRTGLAVLLGLAPDDLPGRLGPFGRAGVAPVGIAVVLGVAAVTALAGTRGAAAVGVGVLTALVLAAWASRREERWTSDLADGGALLMETIALLATAAVR